MSSLEIEMRLLGKAHNRTTATFNDLVVLQPKMVARYKAVGDYAAALKIQNDRVRVLAAHYGRQDRRVTDAQRELGDIELRGRLSPELRDELKQAEARDAEGRLLFKKHQYREAIAPVQEVLALRTKALGSEHADTVGTFNNLELIYRKLIGESLEHEDYASAGRMERELGRLFERRFGEKDWRAIDARLKQSEYERRAQLPADARASLKLAAEREKQFMRLSDKHAFREALRPAEEELALVRKVFGEEHLETARCLNYVAVLHSRLDERSVAESCYRRILEIARKTAGEDHPQTALVLNNLARNCEANKEFEKSLGLFQEALAIRKRVLGETHVDTRLTYDDLARLEQTIADQHLAKEDFEGARRMLDELISLLRQRYGEKDWHVTDARLKRSDVELRERLSPDARAELKQADELMLRVFEKFNKKEFADAAADARRVLEIRKRILGEEHRGTASAYNFLGMDLGMMGNHAAAVPMHERALAIRRKSSVSSTAKRHLRMGVLRSKSSRLEIMRRRSTMPIGPWRFGVKSRERTIRKPRIV